MQLSTNLETNTYGERYLPAVNGGLFANRCAQHTFEQRLSDEFWLEDTCHLVIGSDSGLLINYVHHRGVPPGSVYLFIEPPALETTIAQLTASTVAGDPAIHLTNADQWIAVANPLRLETYILKKRVLIHQSLAACATAQSLYSPQLQSVISALDTTAYTAKLCLVDKSLIHQALRNVSENSLPVTQLEGQFKGKTALIMGAGPSLNDHLEWIRAHREHLVVFAASRLSEYLMDAGLTPDIVVSIDHQPINYEVSKQMLKLPPEVVLLNANHVSPALLSQWRGKRLFVGELVPWQADINVDNLQEECGPTVTNTALVAAGALGFSRILLSGVDFCSPAGERTHAIGDDLKEKHRRTHPVTTNDGQIANSNVQMVLAANTMSEQALRIQHSQIINLAPGACRMEGVEHCPVDDIGFETTARDNAGNGFPELNGQQRIAHNQQVLEELQATGRQLKAIIRLCEDAFTFNKKIYKKDKQGNYNLKAKDKLDNIQQKLDTEFSHLAVIIKKVGMDFFIDSMTTRDIHRFDDRQLERQGYKYYKAYRDSARLLDQMVTESIERVTSRREEDNPQPDIGKLAKQWDRDRQPGRAVVWQYRHPDLLDTLAEGDRQTLSELQRQFEVGLEPLELVGPRPNRYWNLHRRIRIYFNTTTPGQLQQLLDEMAAKDTDNPRGRELIALGQGYLALLRGNRDLALEHLKQTASRDRDESLLQMITSLALQCSDLSTAEAALADLCRVSDQYAPQYANFLKINRKAAEAAELYTGYLQHHPEDIDTWLALAELYLEAQETELAKIVYTHVLERDPHNQTARAFMKS